ncbi:MAG: flagellar hook-associated protein FlgK [Bacillota bacterium]|jgi:flagellar hook-associated protein 1 FlgK
MISTFFGIESARRGLQVHRRSMETTGHNIANANTPGYSRQEAVHTASTPYTAPALHRVLTPGQLGSGVSVDQVRRIRNEYLDAQYRDNAANEGFWKAKADVAQQAELIFPEPLGRGIQSVMLNFFNDWHELNNNPQDAGVKAAVRESGLELASLFRQTYSQLDHVRESIAEADAVGNIIKGRVHDQIGQINGIVKEIQELNTAIERIKALGNQPNDLMDRRDVLLDKLSLHGELDIQVQSAAQNMISIKMFDSYLLDDNNNQQTLSATMDSNYNFTFVFGTLPPVPPSGTGYLAGLQKSITEVNGFINSLNLLAKELIEGVNATHNPKPPNSGNDFFTGDSASTIEVAGNIIATTANIDGNKALAVAQLRSVPIVNLNNGTMEGYYQGLVSEVGANSKTALDQLTNQLAIREQVESLRESAAGVSLDEELSRMVQFQYGFQASARMMAALDDMLDVIINRLF